MPKVASQVKITIHGGLHAGTYSTFVEDVSPRGLVVAVPMVGQAPIPLQVGDRVHVEHYMPGVARVSFNTTVRGRQGGESPSATLTIPDSVERVQERQWVRLPCTLPAVFMTESRPDDTPVDATPVKTKTGDISGNGVMVWSPESLPKGTRVRLLIELTELKHRIDCISEVMRTIRPESDSAIGGFWLGLRFDIIRESDREAVIRYIFNQQRERKKKGLLI